MKNQQQGLRSTKPKEEPQEVSSPRKRNKMMVKVFDLKETMYSDQMGKFPYLSSKGMQYVMVWYHLDAN